MSPDNIFAAQMWSWPDAVIKRNAHGQVMVVNAAFLSLYGGRVEDWQGHLVTGWSAPPPPGQAVRFETRAAGAHGDPASGERVYDWIESTLADGTSLAVARDVTQHIPPQGQPEVEVQPQAESAPARPLAPPPADSPVFEPVLGLPPEHQAPAATPPVAPPPPPAEAEAETVAPAPAVEPQVEEPVAAAPAIELPVPAVADDTPAEVPAPAPDMTESAPEAVTPEIETRVVETQTFDGSAAEPREFERRALPIEDESAVLGNNWRDAVIAKAVGATGAEAPEPEAAPVAAPVKRASGDGPLRILLAEDNAINALLTRTLLEAEGCIVDTVEDGALAVEAMKHNTYDLIFMDMRMPNLDGLEATRKIRSMDHPSKGLPIIALTANAFDDDRNACFDSGMNDFMTKPVSAEELSEMVAAWTGEQADEKLAKAG